MKEERLLSPALSSLGGKRGRNRGISVDRHWFKGSVGIEEAHLPALRLAMGNPLSRAQRRRYLPLFHSMEERAGERRIVDSM